MKCPRCGHHSPAKSKFCERCGTDFPAPEKKNFLSGLFRRKKEEPQKGKVPLLTRIKKYALLAAVIALAVALIAVGVILALRNPGDGNVYRTHSIAFLYDSKSGMSHVVADGEASETLLNGVVYLSESSFDGSAMAAITQYDTLYAVTAKDVVKLSDDVKKCVISPDGSAIGYIREDGAVYLYNIPKNTSEELVPPDTYEADLLFSANGKYVVVRNLEDRVSLIRQVNKTKVETLPGILVSISNDGKLRYVMNDEGYFCYINRKGEEEILATEPSAVIFNGDRSGFILQTKDGKTSYVKNGREMVDYPTGIRYTQPLTPGNYVVKRDMTYVSLVSHLPVEDFTGELYLTDNGNGTGDLVHLSKAATVTAVTKDLPLTELSKLPMVTENREKIAIRYDRTLYCYTIAYREDTFDLVESLKVAVEVSEYVMDRTGKYIYYLTDRGDVRCLTDGVRDVLLASEIETLYGNGEKMVLFRTAIKDKRGTLYICRNGKKAKQLTDRVMDVLTLSDAFFYCDSFDKATGEGDIYASTDGKSFKKLFRLTMS